MPKSNMRHGCICSNTAHLLSLEVYGVVKWIYPDVLIPNFVSHSWVTHTGSPVVREGFRRLLYHLIVN